MKHSIYSETELIKKIKEKRELSGVSNSFVAAFLNPYLRKHALSVDKLNPFEIKIVVKQIRAKLRNSVGQFQKSSKDRKKLLESGDIAKLVKTHSSCYERISFYPKLKKIIREINPKSILDLGCGLNPLMLAKPGIVYYAYDIREDELLLVEQFFKQNNLNGHTKVYDIRKIDNNLPTVDLCILLKVLEVAGENPRALAEKVLRAVNCKKFLISFSTVKLSGKKMDHPERGWFEKLLEKQNLKHQDLLLREQTDCKSCVLKNPNTQNLVRRFLAYKKFQSENEIFYLIDKAG